MSGEPDRPSPRGFEASRPRFAVRVLPASLQDRAHAIDSLQVTVRSALAALTGNCGGIECDHRWWRLRGAGTAGLPSIRDMTDLVLGVEARSLLAAADIVGGRFAINGGDLNAELAEVCYWGPDAVSWLPLGLGHGAFVSWALSGRTREFYADLRWPGWKAEISGLALDEGLVIYPFPFTAEGRDTSAARPDGAVQCN